MKFEFFLGGKRYKAEIIEDQDGLKIIINDKEFIFSKEKQTEEKEQETLIKIPKRKFIQKEITAPISGIISEIFVKEGDYLKQNQKVLILSSMKMENEIVSEFEGVVKELLVKKGQEVKIGQVLIKLK